MTEAEWMTATDPAPMLEFFQGAGGASGRCGCFVACHCCKLAGGLNYEPRLQLAVDVAERYAESEANEEEFEKAVEAVEEQGLISTHWNGDVPMYRMVEATVSPEANRVARDAAMYSKYLMSIVRARVAEAARANDPIIQEKYASGCGEDD